MAIPWITLLKTVPWTQVISNAPAVASGARKLWNSVTGGGETAPPAPAPVPPVPPVTTDNETLAALQQEVARLQAASDALHQQMRASSELIGALADQNTALIKWMDSTRIRLRWLYFAVVLLAAGLLACLLGSN